LGHTKDMLNVSEKMMLINTEITELYDAIHKNPSKPKDTIESETSDILGRTLLLGLVWGVDFDWEEQLKYHFGKEKKVLVDSVFIFT
jgi:NTP pyrophosphatase (non-canonical NTP hydrolase)